MSNYKTVELDYYDELYSSMSAESLEYRETKYKKQRTQNPLWRVVSFVVFFSVCFAILTPMVFIIKRNAEIHEKQYGVYRLKELASDYRDKTNELKEILESNSSIDDLELYATERLDMVKAGQTNIIVLKNLGREVKQPKFKFNIANGITGKQEN